MIISLTIVGGGRLESFCGGLNSCSGSSAMSSSVDIFSCLGAGSMLLASTSVILGLLPGFTGPRQSIYSFKKIRGHFVTLMFRKEIHILVFMLNSYHAVREIFSW